MKPNNKLITITDEGLKKLTDELEYLKTTKRVEINESIQVARSFGDLSENSEYDEARTQQAKNEARIIELEETLKSVKVINENDIKTDSVNVGTTVKVHDEEYDEDIEYTIVGSTEADPLQDKISDQSPIGSALIGLRLGGKVIVETPGGHVHLTVLEISKS